MAKLRVHNFSVSIDGYAAGPSQSLDEPLGVGGEQLHNWFVSTRTFHKIFGEEGGDEGVDDRFAAAGEKGLGATIMGRNMFGPIRGDWNHDEWKGWWGDNPPYHHPTFVLTHYPRESITMEGGTVFHFVTGGLEDALEAAYQAADGQDVRLAGGASTIQQYLRAGLVDEMHLAYAPMLLGSGERLWDDLDKAPEGYEIADFVGTPAALHVRIVRKA
ncbi:MAG TPA: dihydrofolate reductase family protein [Propionibacteriaceae bacterium]|nr:dihydrofolate reductase family protein [Propionibacteriaceae bacterium]